MPRPFRKSPIKFMCEITRIAGDMSRTTFKAPGKAFTEQASIVLQELLKLVASARLGKAQSLTARSLGNVPILSQVFQILAPNAGQRG
jgi:hypothetical protein